MNTPLFESTSLDSRVKALELTPEGVLVLDQTLLPGAVEYVKVTTAQAMADAIQTMIVRGAPAIGIAGAYGMVLSARTHLAQPDISWDALEQALKQDEALLRSTRPTAVNLGWALDQMLSLLADFLRDDTAGDRTIAQQTLLKRYTDRANAILREDIDGNRRLGDYGAALVPKGARILTHCNAGALATGGYGTALGVVRSAFAKDPSVEVYADETRPRLQGARLTTWELIQDGIPVTLLTDGMSGSLMQAGRVDMVIVGADRITANGDTANKIGTYNLAIVAKAHNIPFYVAAPTSTIDISIETGKQIPIEERDAAEIYRIHNDDICLPNKTKYYNPSFDVTPAQYIAAIITEKGIARPDYTDSIAQFFK